MINNIEFWLARNIADALFGLAVVAAFALLFGLALLVVWVDAKVRRWHSRRSIRYCTGCGNWCTVQRGCASCNGKAPLVRQP